MDLDYILKSIPKQPVRRDYMVHIDDLVSLARILRKDGFTVVRRQDYAGMKSDIFDVYTKHEHGLLYHFSLYVDVHRVIKRGTVIIMPDANWYMDRSAITFNENDSLHEWMFRTRFNE